MEKLLITGITNGVLIDADQFKENLKFFEGKKVDVIIKNHTTKRTNPQNRFWNGVVLPYSEKFSFEDGKPNSVKVWHEYFIFKGFFGYKEVNGELIPKRSSEATTLEFNEAIDKAQKFWAVNNHIIPDPNQTDFLDEETTTT